MGAYYKGNLIFGRPWVIIRLMAVVLAFYILKVWSFRYSLNVDIVEATSLSTVSIFEINETVGLKSVLAKFKTT